jgi:hypothetical protein
VSNKNAQIFEKFKVVLENFKVVSEAPRLEGKIPLQIFNIPLEMHCLGRVGDLTTTRSAFFRIFWNLKELEF